MEELIINDDNFNDYFFDVRINRPKKGQVMAKYTAVAYFVASPQKMDIIKLLKTDKATSAAQLMKKIHLAKEPDCFRVCREICEDINSGMSDEEIMNKEYQFIIQAVFYTKSEYVPKNDPHWETLSLLKFNPESNSFESSIEIDIEKNCSPTK